MNIPLAYLGSPFSHGRIHREDGETCSHNHNHGGGEAAWLTFPRAFIGTFNELMESLMPAEYKITGCHQLMYVFISFTIKIITHNMFGNFRHKTLMVHPRLLAENGIPVAIFIQEPGSSMQTGYGTPHQVTNMDFTLKSAMNLIGPA